MGITVLHDTIMEVTSCHLCCILLVRSKSQVPLTIKRRESHSAVNTRRGRGVHL